MKSWPDLDVAPIGMDLPQLKLDSTEKFPLPTKGKFKSYVCGITPYDATHIGHAFTYLIFDLIHRYEILSGLEVEFVENITDIDDPLLVRAARDGVNWESLATSQINLFTEDMTALRVIPPKDFIPVTAVMSEIELAISRLEQNGFTYQLEDDLYFDVSSFIEELPVPLSQALQIFAERGGDPERVGKRHKLDPILWLANREGEPGWDSKHGFGRPGWHIECSVIALSYLLGVDYLEIKQTSPLINLQGGGSDLIFPHHFMSSALAKALTGCSFAGSYVHSAMVGYQGKKMSKSKGNLVFVSSLLNEGVEAMAIRHALIKNHYRKDWEWTEEILKESEVKIALIRSALSAQDVAETSEVIRELIKAVADDLNITHALDLVEKWAKESIAHGGSDKPGALSRTLDSLLGLAL